MAGDPTEKDYKAPQTETKKPFGFRQELTMFLLADGEYFPDYYEGEAKSGRPKEQSNSQICTRVEYETVVKMTSVRMALSNF